MGMVFISEFACDRLKEDLRKAGHEVFEVMPGEAVYDAISTHPDIYMCSTKNALVIDDSINTRPGIREIYDREMSEKLDGNSGNLLIPAISSDGNKAIVFQMGNIGPEYPLDVPYNAVCTERYFIHNLEHTSPLLLERARAEGLELINVKQGYTKCSCIVVGGAIVTADRGIFRTISAYNDMLNEEGEEEGGIDILLVEPGHVKLQGFESGFIGGTCGQVGDKVYFNGDLSSHPDFRSIVEFIWKHGAEPIWYGGELLEDIGSVIYID
ncbi:MAG: hypothetical protein PUA82_00995 [Eubacteriales bacterium]|jgi:hypothetical protein|nr:hypothetical protein [Eubacteriales bacterium]